MAWTVAVRTDGDLSTLTPAVREAIRGYDPRVYLWTVGSLKDHLNQGPMAAPRSTALVLTAFGLAALLLAAVGLFGVVALAVDERTRELGIRRALGASEHALRRNVMRDALCTTSLGGVAGIAVAVLISRLLAPLLFEVSPVDPVTILGVSAVILATCFVACYVPVRRVTRIDPRVALQGE